MSEMSLAFIGNASAVVGRSEGEKRGAEAFSIRRLEGSRWRFRRTRHLWGLKATLIRADREVMLLIVAAMPKLGFPAGWRSSCGAFKLCHPDRD